MIKAFAKCGSEEGTGSELTFSADTGAVSRVKIHSTIGHKGCCLEYDSTILMLDVWMCGRTERCRTSSQVDSVVTTQIQLVLDVIVGPSALETMYLLMSHHNTKVH
jgi:hypothetical protein